MKTAIVILNWNGAHFLEKFLPALLAHSTHPDNSLWVADNGSTDRSMQLLSEQFPQVNTLVFDKNYGFAGGYNKALQLIDAEYYVLLNSDVEVTPHWLESMIDYLDAHPDVAACQPKIMSYDLRLVFEHAGAAGGFIDYLGYPLCRGRVLATLETDYGQYDHISDIFWATGACLVIRSSVYHECGRLDDDFFAHMEEIDLCWRIRSRGKRIVCIPESVVYHVGGGTLQKEHPRKTYLNFRNNLLLLYKNLPKKQLRFVLYQRFFLDYIAALQLLLTGKPRNAWAVLQARRDYRRMRPSFKARRKENLEKAVLIHIPEIIRNSIIFNYYLRKKKRFSDLVKTRGY